MKQMDADKDLFALVFGESIFNDAISIVMYNTVKEMEVSQYNSAISHIW